MENHHFQWINPPTKWTIFHSYVKLPEGNRKPWILHVFYHEIWGVSCKSSRKPMNTVAGAVLNTWCQARVMFGAT